MILSLFIIVPLLAAIALFAMRDEGSKAAASLALLVQGFLGVELVQGGFQHFRVDWLPQLGVHWSLGLDHLNYLLVVLCPLITLLAVRTVQTKTPRVSVYLACLLLMDACLSGLFLAQNLGLFYIFFEGMLLPAAVLISGWSKQDGSKTALKFLMYTLVGSLPMLLGMMVLAFGGLSKDGLEFGALGGVSEERQLFLLLPFLLAFAVKMPLLPFHGWLPALYRNTSAPAVAVIAALMSKAGTYGLLKVGHGIFPEGLRELSGLLAVLAVLSILYGAFAALGADELRTILAFSSLSHIGMICFGIVSFNSVGYVGAGLQMAAHAVATGGLFLVVAQMENRSLPGKLRRFGGLAKHTPRLAALSLFLVLSSLGQPGLGSFPAELFILNGTWSHFKVLTILAGLGIVLAAAYLLRFYQKVFTGKQGTYRVPSDLGIEESLVLIVLILSSLAMGFFPGWFTSWMSMEFGI